MTSVGVRELKNSLSEYIRRTESGERIAVTSHGRVVAELVAPGHGGGQAPGRYQQLVAAGIVRAAPEHGRGPAGWPAIHLAAGVVAELLEGDRGEE